MYTISKQFLFSAAHHLFGLPLEHPCSRQHGHNYVVTVELRCEYLDETGFVTDYRALAPIKKFLDETFDHRDLNDIIQQPTAENLARFIYDRFIGEFPYLCAVSVSETEKTSARYEK